MRRLAAFALLAIACHRSPTEPDVPSLNATLAGRVSILETGAPVPGSRVVVSGDKLRRETAADHAGVFRFDELPPGVYTIEADLSPSKALHLTITVQPGPNWLELPISTGQCLLVFGFVRDANTGRGIAGATVYVVDQATTNALGWYTVNLGCPPHWIGSSVSLMVEHPNYKPYQSVLIMFRPGSSLALRDVLMEPR